MAASALALQAAAVSAADLATNSKLDAVTVFGEGAKITRTASLQVPAGEHVIVISGLPGGLDEDSLTAALTSGGAVLGAVELREIIAEDLIAEEEQRLTDELLKLNDQRQALNDTIASANLQVKFLESLSAGYGEKGADEAMQGQANPAAWLEALRVIGNGTDQAKRRIRESTTAMRDLNKQITAVQRRLQQVRSGVRETYEARLSVGARAASTIGVSLSYLIDDAWWYPVYEARLDTKSHSMRLVQSGRISQQSGEEWQGITLTLSTAKPSADSAPPELDPWFIDIARPTPVYDGERFRRELAPGMAAQTAPEPELDAVEEIVVTGQQRQFTALEAGEFVAEYRVAGRVSVRADGSEQTYFIGDSQAELEMFARVVPGEVATAYLLGDFTHSGESPLLPGEVSLYRDGTFTGTGTFGIIRPGEETELSFGADDRIRVDVKDEGGETSTGGLINRRRTIERKFLYEVANQHGEAMDIEVLARLPVPRNEQIEVELLKSATPPDETDVEEKKGVVMWRRSYGAGEKAEIRLHYAVSLPKDAQLDNFAE